MGEFAHTRPEYDWSLKVPEDLPPVVADPARLREVFQNLLANAAKYSEPGTPVTVTAGVAGGEVAVTVADHGIGIAPADHERIFELFRRSGTQNTTGEGIGLAHVRTMVRNLGGDITVRSQLGSGTTFTIQLPIDLALHRRKTEA